MLPREVLDITFPNFQLKKSKKYDFHFTFKTNDLTTLFSKVNSGAARRLDELMMASFFVKSNNIY
jgi:hypothetical protein